MVTQLPNIDVAAATYGSSAKGVSDPATTPQKPSSDHVKKGKRGRTEPKVQKDQSIPVKSRNGIFGEVDTFKQRLHIPKDVQNDHMGNKVEYATFYATADGLHYEINGKNYRVVAVNSEGPTQNENANKLSDDSNEKTPSKANTYSSNRPTFNGNLDMNAAAAAIRRIESGSFAGNYSAQSGASSASGAYQFINSTWKSASASAGYGGQYASAAQAPKAVQDAVFNHYFSGLVSKYGANGAVNAYFTGNPSGILSSQGQAANSINASQYQSKFWDGYNKSGGEGGSADQGSSGGGGGTSDENRQTCVPASESQGGDQGTPGSNPGNGTPGGGGGPLNGVGTGHLTGVMDVNGKGYNFGSGGANGYAPIPYGTYPITPNTIGPWGQAHGAIGINNNAIYDSSLGRTRTGIEFHAASNSNLFSHGCVAIDPSQYSSFKSDVNNMIAQNGSAYLTINPNGAFISPDGKTPSTGAGSVTPSSGGNQTTPSSGGNQTTPSSTGDQSTPSNTGKSKKDDTEGGNAPPLPPVPEDVSDLNKKMDESGITGDVQKLTKLTGDLNQITTTIAQLLPGAPYSFIGIAAQLVKNLGTIQKGLNGILGDLDPSVQTIMKSLGTVPNLQNMSGMMQQTLSGLTNSQFVSLLPPNLSMDKLMGGMFNMNPSMLSGLMQGSGSGGNQGAFSALQSLMAVASNPPTTTLPSDVNQTLNSVLNLPEFNQVSDLNVIKDTVLPPSAYDDGVSVFDDPSWSFSVTPNTSTASLQTSSIQPTALSIDGLVTTNIEPQEQLVESTRVTTEAEAHWILQLIYFNEISKEEWEKLICATSALEGTDLEEFAWFIKTVINRCTKTGSSITEVLKQFGNFNYAYTPDDITKDAIYDAIFKFIRFIPNTNFYFDRLTPDEINTEEPISKQRNGILGLRIGNSLVYPGARWP